MTEIDLALVPIDDLIREVESRCKTFVMAYELPDDVKLRNLFVTWFGKGNLKDAAALVNILNNDCLNNWNGELKTLQRINQEEEDGE
ncbi:MAG: hypothetical protein A4E53_01659 [Pelotomaculum sp. PtaB.Bin104]|nr:MAG: hypothetical protein A4E53_01659 [Pelotomaculum sp. PtaB.Bin104]